MAQYKAEPTFISKDPASAQMPQKIKSKLAPMLVICLPMVLSKTHSHAKRQEPMIQHREQV